MLDYWNRKLLSRRKALRVAAVAGGLAAITLSGCGDSDDASDSGKGTTVTDSTQGKPGGTLNVQIGGTFGSISPIDRATGFTQRAVSLINSGLLAYKWGVESVDINDVSPDPDLAQALPEQSPDQLSYTFKLRPGVKFHNGQPVTAEDVKYSFDEAATRATSQVRAQASVWYDKMETPDPQTVVLKTKFPYADAVEATQAQTGFFIVSKAWEQGPDTVNKTIGSGPYMWDRATLPLEIHLKKNPDYYLKPYPYFDEVTFYGATDVEARIAAFTSGQIHMPWVVNGAQERDRMRRAVPTAKEHVFTPYPAAGIIMRCDQSPMNDKRVRQAMSMALDQKKISAAVDNGEGEPDQFFIRGYSSLYGTRTNVKDLGAAAKYWNFDIAEAKRLFAAAGQTKPMEGEMQHWDATVVGSYLPDAATLIQQQLREAGIANLTDRIVNSSQASSAGFGVGIYDSFATTISVGPGFFQRGIATRNLISWADGTERPASNNSYIKNATLTDLAEKQMRQLNQEERKSSFRQIEDIMAEEQYRIALNSTSQTWFTAGSVANTRVPVHQGSLRFAMKWWFA